MIDSLIQILILILSASSIWIIGRTESWSRYGYIVGLCGQPFWLYTTGLNHQWGLFTLSIFYVYSWSMGIYNKFYKI